MCYLITLNFTFPFFHLLVTFLTAALSLPFQLAVQTYSSNSSSDHWYMSQNEENLRDSVLKCKPRFRFSFSMNILTYIDNIGHKYFPKIKRKEQWNDWFWSCKKSWRSSCLTFYKIPVWESSVICLSLEILAFTNWF